MASTALSVAQSVTSYLKGNSIPCALKLIPDLDLVKAKDLLVQIVPHGLESKVITRNNDKDRTVIIDIGVMKRASENDLPHLLEYVENIGDLLEGKNIGNYRCEEVAYAPLYDTEIWLQQHSFFCVIVARIKVI